MSSKSRKFRRKPDDPVSLQDQESTANGDTAKPSTLPKKEKEKKPKKVTLLSFDEEETGSPVKVKTQLKERPKPKLRPNLQGLSIKEDAKPISTQQSGAG